MESKERSELLRELLAIGVREKKLRHAVKMYEDGKISRWKVARIADISLWRMTEELKNKRIEVRYGEEELTEDPKALEESR